jgi:hypothetical protein
MLGFFTIPACAQTRAGLYGLVAISRDRTPLTMRGLPPGKRRRRPYWFGGVW